MPYDLIFKYDRNILWGLQSLVSLDNTYNNIYSFNFNLFIYHGLFLHFINEFVEHIVLLVRLVFVPGEQLRFFVSGYFHRVKIFHSLQQVDVLN